MSHTTPPSHIARACQPFAHLPEREGGVDPLHRVYHQIKHLPSAGPCIRQQGQRRQGSGTSGRLESYLLLLLLLLSFTRAATRVMSIQVTSRAGGMASRVSALALRPHRLLPAAATHLQRRGTRESPPRRRWGRAGRRPGAAHRRNPPAEQGARDRESTARPNLICPMAQLAIPEAACAFPSIAQALFAAGLGKHVGATRPPPLTSSGSKVRWGLPSRLSCSSVSMA